MIRNRFRNFFRNSFRNKEVFDYLSLILLGCYTLYAYSINRLTFLIHPRYLWATLAVAIFIIVLGLSGLVRLVRMIIFPKLAVVYGVSKVPIWSFLVFSLSVIIFFVPITSLSGISFKNRSSGSSSANISFTAKEKELLQSKIDQGFDTRNYKFTDWVAGRTLNDNKFFEGKKFKEVGFITPYQDGTEANSGNNGSKRFMLSRYVISCCAIDATPLSLVVEYDYKKDGLSLGSWVMVEGTFAIKDANGSEQPIIIPDYVSPIKEPDDAYISRN